jgi:hypothetical protein
MSLETLNSYLQLHSYVGNAARVTRRDYEACAIKETEIDKVRHPHAARWHAHIKRLILRHPLYDWRGDVVQDSSSPEDLHVLERTSTAESTMHNDNICWARAAGGYLAARPMPRDAQMLQSWECTTVVTLTEDDRKMGELTKELSLQWIHAPLAPISNARKKISESDIASFKENIPKALELLKACGRVIVHCQAGCHRTGIFCFVLLRQGGYSSDAALDAIKQSRLITWEELTLKSKKRPAGLIPKAEQIYQEVFCELPFS